MVPSTLRECGNIRSTAVTKYRKLFVNFLVSNFLRQQTRGFSTNFASNFKRIEANYLNSIHTEIMRKLSFLMISGGIELN